jgi:hypothetical protein
VPGTAVEIGPGAYEVTESGPAGYKSVAAAGCSGTIALGETKTCTMTSDDQPATLVVIKTVVNDSGGTSVASDWTLSVAGNNPVPASFPGG